MNESPSPVTIYVDPCCPFAWITQRWLSEVEQAGRVELTVRLLSLAVVNEGRELDPWYRWFNDQAWAPARVMAAVEQADGEAAARRFYEAFGQHFHVGHNTSDDANRLDLVAAALADAGLPAERIEAATSGELDDDLRQGTTSALARVGLDVGVPVTIIDGVASSGPVLTRIPRRAEAVQVWDAARTLARFDGYVRFERQRVGELHTA